MLFYVFFPDHLQYKHYYCTLYSLTCCTIKKIDHIVSYLANWDATYRCLLLCHHETLATLAQNSLLCDLFHCLTEKRDRVLS